MADRFEDLRTYVTVVSCGGINAAAAELGIAKSAVSRRISDLEARLGVTLLDRSNRRFDATAAGQAYFDRARDLLAKLEQLDADPAALNASAHVTVAADLAVMRHLLASPLAAFSREREGVVLHLVGPDEPAEVSIGMDENGGHRLADVKYVLCAAPDYLAEYDAPATTSDLGGHAGILLVDQDESWQLSGGGARSPRTVVEAADADVALALTLTGLGIAQLPDFVVQRALAEKSLVQLLETATPPPRRLAASVSSDASTAAHALVDALAAGLADRR
ncbi:MAG: LysR family transcriptional regulator [Sphingomonas phyllosphaerae]|uniref:LysR family transcriptional regulator n=1 Tax=Sphingomonas phyllosphaerae TaxID=257003 RepID=UPI002FF73D84